MDPISSVSKGWSIGVGAGEAVLKYDASVYQARIDELGRIKTTLDGHLDNLRSLKAEVPSFWDDSLGLNVASVVDKWIKNIEEADRKIEIMQRTFRDLAEGIEGRISESEEAIDAVKAVSDVTTGIIGASDL